MPRHRLRGKKKSFPGDCFCQHEIPVVPCNVERRFAHIAACIVDQDMDLVEGLGSFRDCGFDALLAAHVEFEGQCPPAKPLDLGHDGRECFALPAGEHQIGARDRQGASKKVCPRPLLVPVTIATWPVRSKSGRLMRWDSRLPSSDLARVHRDGPNQRGPSLSGATALISGATRIRPLAIISIASAIFAR